MPPPLPLQKLLPLVRRFPRMGKATSRGFSDPQPSRFGRGLSGLQGGSYQPRGSGFGLNPRQSDLLEAYNKTEANQKAVDLVNSSKFSDKAQIALLKRLRNKPEGERYLLHLNGLSYEHITDDWKPPKPDTSPLTKLMEADKRTFPDQEFGLTDLQKQWLEQYNKHGYARAARRFENVSSARSNMQRLKNQPRGQRYLLHLQGKPYDHIPLSTFSNRGVERDEYGLLPKHRTALDLLRKHGNITKAADEANMGRAQLGKIYTGRAGQSYLEDNPLKFKPTVGGRFKSMRGRYIRPSKKVVKYEAPREDLTPPPALSKKVWRDEMGLPPVPVRDDPRSFAWPEQRQWSSNDMIERILGPSIQEEVPENLTQEDLQKLFGAPFSYKKRF